MHTSKLFVTTGGYDQIIKYDKTLDTIYEIL